MKKRMLAVLMMAVLALGLVACGGSAGNKEAYVGTWDLVTMQEGEEVLNVKELFGASLFKFALNEDGTGAIISDLDGAEEPVTWEVQGDGIYIKSAIEDAQEKDHPGDAKIKDGNLVLQSEGMEMHFEKVE